MNEEAIVYFKNYIKVKKEVIKERRKEELNADSRYTQQLEEMVEAFETVLNLLEKKDKEIQFQKEINKTEQDRHKQTEKSLKEQIAKKNNILDKLVSCVPLSIYDFDTNKTYKGRECINFIERKVEEDK